jgi:hypothetical protein
MTAPGLKARKNCGDLPRDAVCPSSRKIKWSSANIFIECEQDHPPRLCQRDLKNPELFHQRLVDWLMKQR